MCLLRWAWTCLLCSVVGITFRLIMDIILSRCRLIYSAVSVCTLGSCVLRGCIGKSGLLLRVRRLMFVSWVRVPCLWRLLVCLWCPRWSLVVTLRMRYTFVRPLFSLSVRVLVMSRGVVGLFSCIVRCLVTSGCSVCGQKGYDGCARWLRRTGGFFGVTSE